ncbi:MAG: hypothetical protein ACOC5T_10380 [Elusimicrobiota bacterium]
MNDAIHDKSSSTTIAIDFNKEQEEKAEHAHRLIKSVLNGYTDEHIVNAIKHSLEGDFDGVVYPELKKQRRKIIALKAAKTQEDKDYVLRHLTQELVDSREWERRQKKRERRQKYIIALTGLLSTLITSTASVLITYFTKH